MLHAPNSLHAQVFPTAECPIIRFPMATRGRARLTDSRLVPSSSRVVGGEVDAEQSFGIEAQQCVNARDNDASLRKDSAAAGVRLSARMLRCMYCSQLLSVAVLSILAGGLLYFAWRVQSTVNYYYYTAQPYLEEAKDHGASIMLHADASTQSLSRVMAAGETFAVESVPGLVSSVQNATKLMARASELAAHPVVKLSLGE